MRSGSSDCVESHITPKELVAWSGPKEGGGTVQEHDRTPGRVVACDASQEDRKKLNRSTCGSKDHERRFVDLVPVVFPLEDGSGYTSDVFAECWTVFNDGDRSNRSMKKEQTQRRKRGGLEIQPFWDCWIEHALRRKHIEATKEFKEDLKRRKEALVVSGGVLDTEGLEEDVQELFRQKTTQWGEHKDEDIPQRTSG